MILPKEKKGIVEVESKLRAKVKGSDYSSFVDIFSQTRREEVIVYLPKFKFEQTHNLKDHLVEVNLISTTFYKIYLLL